MKVSGFRVCRVGFEGFVEASYRASEGFGARVTSGLLHCSVASMFELCLDPE